jgi:hypothetical protein
MSREKLLSALHEESRAFHASHQRTPILVEQRPGFVPVLTVRYDCQAGGCENHPMCGTLRRQMGMSEEDVQNARKAGLIR